MPNPSNLYAEKIYAEHPIGLWPLDDSLDYLSLFSDAQRDYSSWVPNNSTITTDTDTSAPFNSTVGLISTDTSVSGYSVFGATNSLAIPISKLSLDSTKENISFGVHVKSLSASVISASVGYVYIDVDSGLPQYHTRTFLLPLENTWTFISETFLVSDIPADNFYFVVTAIAAHPEGVPGTITHAMYVDGVTVGQNSEEFNYESLGVSLSPASHNVAGMQSHTLIESPQYGIAGKSAYYVVQNGTDLPIKNAGIPMVYGASNTTIMYDYNSQPMLLIPGYGVMNESGRNKEYTVEFWTRVRSRTTEPTRIMGPIASEDGIYVDGPFIRLKVGNSVISHYINNLFRPLLIHIKILENSIALLINGEQVGSTALPSSTTFPTKFNQNGEDQDYLAFYTSDLVDTLEVDCFAIYSYSVPAIVAKRRFAYGQAVDLPETVNTAYGGSTVYFDYNFADYTNNYSYPGIGRWSQGIADNVEINNNILSVPDYELPTVFIQDGTTYEDWLSSQVTIEGKDPFVTFGSTPGYMYFEQLRLLRGETRAAYIVFETQSISSDKQILMRIEDNLTQNYFEIYTYNEEVVYNLVYDDVVTTLYAESGLIANSKSFAGIDIDGLATYFGRNFSTFFGNRSRLSVYVGADKSYGSPFSGYIYSVNFCTDKNFRQISGLFQDAEIASTEFIADGGDAYFGVDSGYWYKTFDGGSVDSFSLDAANTHIASYTLRPRIMFDNFELDIAVSSSWQDYVPLKYFAQYVDQADDPYYDLDFIQLNLGYTAPKIYSNGNYDTSNNPIRMYVTFQSLQSGATQNSENYTSSINVPVSGVIEPGDEWLSTKYEVINGVVLYPPKSIDFTDIGIVVHIEMVSQGVISDRLRIKTLELASQAYNSETSNPIGTRFGVPAYPYRKYGLYYDYKSKNPYRIYKNSSPYLYLTSDNGIQKIGEIDPLVDRGIVVPVNPNIADEYRVVSMQASIMFPNVFDQKIKVFEVEAKNYYYRFYIEKLDESGKRAKLYAVNAKTGAINSGITFYVNGKLVREAVITTNEWAMIGIGFADILDFDSYVGGIRLTGPMVINNISHYQSTNLQEIQRQELREWAEALSPDGVSTLIWSYWSNTFIWNEVLIKSTTNVYGITPDIIYKTYVGTNKIIVDDQYGSVMLENYEYPVYSDVKWSSATVSVV